MYINVILRACVRECVYTCAYAVHTIPALEDNKHCSPSEDGPELTLKRDCCPARGPSLVFHGLRPAVPDHEAQGADPLPGLAVRLFESPHTGRALQAQRKGPLRAPFGLVAHPG